jgi:PAS domain S-box-containing protein
MKLDLSEATLQRAQRVAKTGSWSIDLQRNLIEFSDEAYRLFDLPNGSPVTYEAIQERVHPDEREMLKKVWRQALKDEAAYDIEYRVVQGDGSILWLHATAELFGDKNGRAIEAVGTVQDITMQKETETALIAAKHAADLASKAKSEFLSNMSHELRTPLNAILGFAQLIYDSKKPAISDRHKEHLQYVIEGGEHLLRLINEILDLARIEAGNLQISLEAVSVSELIGETMAFCAPLAEKYNVRLDDRVGHASFMIIIDRTRGKQILLNLLSNAIKYNRDGGQAWIEAKKIGNRMRITIGDTGYGISPGKQVELFKPFSRLGAEASSIEGTGIGLVLTRHLVEKMDGIIGLDSQVDVGSRFWVEFPLGDEDAKAEEILTLVSDDKISLGAFGTKPRLLLYVEDNQANLFLVEEIVKDIPSLTLISASTAEQGLSLAISRQPDIILLDINLPGMDGIEALGHLKRNPLTRDIPVIALSADATRRTIERGQAAGFLDYLVKPLKISDFIRALQRAIA